MNVGCRDLRVFAGRTQLLHVPALHVQAGSALAVMGVNGAGKSTLLRALGMLGPHRVTGEVLLDGAPTTRHAMRRAVAAVLQRPILRRGTVLANVVSGLRFRGMLRREARRRAGPWMDALGVGHLAGRDARSLSGGEAQRVSLARALAVEPRVLLLDEPFTGLDATTRTDLLADLRAVLDGRDTATVMVTHDRHEAVAFAAAVAVLVDGRLRRHGPTVQVVDDPGDVDTARLLGWTNVIPTDSGAARVARPENSRLAVGPGQHPGVQARGRLRRVVPLGATTRVDVDTATGQLTCLYPGNASPGALPSIDSDVVVLLHDTRLTTDVGHATWTGVH